jgi:prephenate dehydrogenase
MHIGILGSGLMGSKLGTIFARAGHDVVFSYSTSERKLKRLARESGGHARAGTPREAALDADALLLAVHWSRVAYVLRQAGDLTGKVIFRDFSWWPESMAGNALEAWEFREEGRCPACGATVVLVGIDVRKSRVCFHRKT